MTDSSPYPNDDIGFRQLRAANVHRCARWLKDNPWHPNDWMTATVGELGEAANVLKKLKRAEDAVTGANDPSVETLSEWLAEELADTVIYLDLLAASCNVDLAEAVAGKFNQVSDREGFPEALPVPGLSTGDLALQQRPDLLETLEREASDPSTWVESTARRSRPS